MYFLPLIIFDFLTAQVVCVFFLISFALGMTTRMPVRAFVTALDTSSHLLYLVTEFTITSTSDCGRGGLQAWELAYNNSL